MQGPKSERWQTIGDELENSILEVVKDVGGKIADQDSFISIAKSEDSYYVFYEGTRLPTWIDVSLAQGYPGICVFLGELNEHFPDENWDCTAHEYMIRLQESIARYGIPHDSLFSGLAGIGMSALVLSQGRTRYTRFISQVNGLLVDHLPDTLQECYSRLGQVRMGDYDVTQGLAGIGRYLLFFKDDSTIRSLLEETLSYAVKLTRDIMVSGHSVPGWYISAQNQFLEAEKSMYSQGNFNCGLSHGIPGPLALLSVALINGVEVDGHRAAIKKIADWLEGCRVFDDRGFFWPGRVSWEDYLSGNSRVPSSRAAWCYGTPGVARSLWLAGSALDDISFKEIAIDSMLSLFSRTEESWRLWSPTFCHGFAGLLHITNLMYGDTGLEVFDIYRRRFASRILKFYDPDSPLGFYNIEQEGTGLAHKNDAGLLTGVIGIALTLLALVKPVATCWDAALLIT